MHLWVRWQEKISHHKEKNERGNRIIQRAMSASTFLQIYYTDRFRFDLELRLVLFFQAVDSCEKKRDR